MIYETINLKKCTSCRNMYEATTEFFNKHPSGKYGLNSKCRSCTSKYASEYIQKDYDVNSEKYKERNNKWRNENREYFRLYMNQLNQKIRDSLGIGYDGLHKLIRKIKEKPESCDICKKKKKLELHSIDHTYTKNPKDWLYICKKCNINQNGGVQE